MAICSSLCRLWAVSVCNAQHLPQAHTPGTCSPPHQHNRGSRGILQELRSPGRQEFCLQKPRAQEGQTAWSFFKGERNSGR